MTLREAMEINRVFLWLDKKFAVDGDPASEAPLHTSLELLDNPILLP